MRIDGLWLPFDDGALRPVVNAQVLDAKGSWQDVPFLVDTGADRTVFSAAIVDALQFPKSDSGGRLGGVGGVVASVEFESQIRLRCDDGGQALFRSNYAGFVDFDDLDISVIGRDILNLFALIVDRSAGAVTLLCQRHRYQILFE